MAVAIINTKEAAKVMGCSPRTVRRLCKDGKLPGKKIGRDWLLEQAPPAPTINRERRG